MAAADAARVDRAREGQNGRAVCRRSDTGRQSAADLDALLERTGKTRYRADASSLRKAEEELRECRAEPPQPLDRASAAEGLLQAVCSIGLVGRANRDLPSRLRQALRVDCV